MEPVRGRVVTSAEKEPSLRGLGEREPRSQRERRAGEVERLPRQDSVFDLS